MAINSYLFATTNYTSTLEKFLSFKKTFKIDIIYQNDYFEFEPLTNSKYYFIKITFRFLN